MGFRKGETTPANSEVGLVTTRNKLAAALAAGFAVLLMVVGFGGAQGAGADTPECASSVQTHNGITANYCASQAIAAAGVELAVPNKARAYSRLTFKVTSTTNRQEDFEFFNPAVHPDNQKIMEWAPGGSPSGLCAVQLRDPAGAQSVQGELGRAAVGGQRPGPGGRFPVGQRSQRPGDQRPERRGVHAGRTCFDRRLIVHIRPVTWA